MMPIATNTRPTSIPVARRTVGLERSVGGRDRDPRDDVRGNADPEDAGDDPQDAHERDVEAVGLGDPRGDTAQDPVGAVTPQAAVPETAGTEAAGAAAGAGVGGALVSMAPACADASRRYRE